jgi:hypothetical protein
MAQRRIGHFPGQATRSAPTLPIPEAEKFEHSLKVQRFLMMLRAGKQVIGLRGDIPAMSDAQDLYKEEREVRHEVALTEWNDMYAYQTQASV